MAKTKKFCWEYFRLKPLHSNLEDSLPAREIAWWQLLLSKLVQLVNMFRCEVLFLFYFLQRVRLIWDFFSSLKHQTVIWKTHFCTYQGSVWPIFKFVLWSEVSNKKAITEEFCKEIIRIIKSCIKESLYEQNNKSVLWHECLQSRVGKFSKARFQSKVLPVLWQGS